MAAKHTTFEACRNENHTTITPEIFCSYSEALQFTFTQKLVSLRILLKQASSRESFAGAGATT